MADRLEADAKVYIDAMAATQRRLDGSKPTTFGTPEEIARFAQAIASYEGVAELRAHNAVKMQKRAERQAKLEAKLYPSVTVARRKILKRLLETDRRLIDAILDHALFRHYAATSPKSIEASRQVRPGTLKPHVRRRSPLVGAAP
ncbi:hypothetical protein INQ30_24225, partial [Escherichia coli]|nr:hypothetical protein [Escherichia coli]